MNVNLKERRILVGVTGSIAAYKSCELVRLFVKSGAQVRVVMSESAKKFVSPLTFEALSGAPVLHEASESWADINNHIALGQWAEIMVLAPATANTINKIANGIGDNLLLQTVLAFDKTIIFAPAANTNMITNPITQSSMKLIALNRFEAVATQTKELACRTTGDGAMAEPSTIFWQSARALLKNEAWEERMVVVTGGGTVEKIDDVRYVGNFSSGKMAQALAQALFLKGADVCLITTANHDALPPVHLIKVENATQMQEYITDSMHIAKKGKLTKPSFHSERPELIQKTPYLFMAAAVSDYRPANPQHGKLKKTALGENWNLSLVQNPDILAALNKQGIRTVAFKAEMDEQNALTNAIDVLRTKGVDAVALNILHDSQSFGSDTNAITLLREGKEDRIERADKLSVALQLLDLLEA